ncbi:prostaglandin-E synthase [Ranunculus cassubicifolius]
MASRMIYKYLATHSSPTFLNFCPFCSRHPELKWAQREDKLYITIMLSDAKDAKVSLEPQGTFTFSATAGGENHLYEMELHLFNNVNVEESKINKTRKDGGPSCCVAMTRRLTLSKLIGTNGQTKKMTMVLRWIQVEWISRTWVEWKTLTMTTSFKKSISLFFKTGFELQTEAKRFLVGNILV